MKEQQKPNNFDNDRYALITFLVMSKQDPKGLISVE